VLCEARAAAGATIRLDVFADYAQVQRSNGFVKRLGSGAETRAYTELTWGDANI